MVLGKVTLVIGGAASGKSAHAEQMFAGVDAPVYLATAQAFDDEMRDKIDAHIARRGARWRTVEAPLDVVGALDGLGAQDHCLFDCATLWLSNQLLAENDLAAEQARLVGAVSGCAARLVIVTNEVGMGVVPDTPLGRRFREAQGRLNIELAQVADRVIHVVAGLPRVLKP
ncbi:MAG: bifunctional adenosylcobinamide kinase/adenosylcobinamide-phosphate guanylyltransferase [Pseudooceanicola sp.]|nr:bifunctional adenosylcobinamide kinase/adenosylcobinamide-phosphate guanylyltransferase [Pseudooceanicola sp.]